MSRSIKIADELMDNLRFEAQINSRSIAGQAEHWIKIGRAIEKSPSFNYQRIREALSGSMSPDELTAEEQDIFFDEFADMMIQGTPEQEEFFSKRRKAGLGVGLDENDNIIYQTPEE